MRHCPRPENGALCVFIVDIVLKRSLVLLTLLSSSKNHFKKGPCYIWPYSVQDNTQRIIGYCHSTVKCYRVRYWYWSHYYFLEMEVTKYTLCFFVHLTIMIILYLSCFILKCHVSLFFSPFPNQWFLGILCHNCSKQSTNSIKFDFQYWSTPTFEVTQFPLHKGANNKHRSNITVQPIVVS